MWNKIGIDLHSSFVTFFNLDEYVSYVVFQFRAFNVYVGLHRTQFSFSNKKNSQKYLASSDRIYITRTVACSSLNIDDNEKINKMINEEDNETFWHGLPQMSKPIIIWCHIDAPRNVVSENPTIYSQAIQTSLL